MFTNDDIKVFRSTDMANSLRLHAQYALPILTLPRETFSLSIKMRASITMSAYRLFGSKLLRQASSQIQRQRRTELPTYVEYNFCEASLLMIQFQWAQLVRYGLSVTKQLSEKHEEQGRLSKRLDDLERLNKRYEKELSGLNDTPRRLQYAEAKLDQWQDREPRIMAYLEVTKRLIEQVKSLLKL